MREVPQLDDTKRKIRGLRGETGQLRTEKNELSSETEV